MRKVELEDAKVVRAPAYLASDWRMGVSSCTFMFIYETQ